MINTKRITEDNRTYITYVQEEVSRLKDQQIKNIEKGFGELIRRLEEK